MKLIDTGLPGVLLIEPDVFGDHRGYFKESWNQRKYEELGIKTAFVQDNLSFSSKGILRGLHFQNPNPQGKLVQVLLGDVYDVAVDVRVGSPHFGKWFGTTLSAENHLQMYVPEGFAHGFVVLSEQALFAYKCTEFYNPKAEHSLRFDDPDLGIHWPLEQTPTLSNKDSAALCLKDFQPEQLPVYPST